MKRLLKWAGLGLAGIVALLLVAIVGLYAASETMIRWPVEKPKTQLVASSDPGAADRGHRVAVVNGCHDCHGQNLEGKLFHDEMPIIRAYAPNLTLALVGQTDAAVDGAIRHGVAGNGRRLWIMPSSAFSRLSDQEAADLVAYLRTFKPHGDKQPRFQVGPVGRLGVALGKFKSEPDMLAAEAGETLADLGPRYAEGRELARACIECHGPSLGGSKVVKSPDLTMAASYDREDFAKLLRTGVAAGGRRVGLMSQIAPVRFNVLTSGEIDALHEYLKARAERQIARADVTSAGTSQR